MEVIAVSQGGQELEEAQTIALMARYGWRFVRGGRYTTPALASQPKPLGIVLARGVPSKVPKPAFLEEIVLVGGHCLRIFQALEGRVFGALAGPMCNEERRFAGGGVDDIRAAAEGWLRGRKRRVRGWFLGYDEGALFVVRKRRLFDEGVCGGCKGNTVEYVRWTSDLSIFNSRPGVGACRISDLSIFDA